VLPEIAIGKKRGPRPIESVESTMQAPIRSPTARSKYLFLIAATFTTSSGRLVPKLSRK